MPVAPEIVLDEDDLEVLPPVLAGHSSPAIERKTRTLYMSVRSMFETWLQRTENPNTQRTYRRGVLNFIEFLGIDWDERSHEFLQVTVPDVQAWRDSMQAEGQAPATLNSRISAVSRFYKFMRELAAELRLPMVPPNPAHPVFIKRQTVEAVQPTAALTRSLGHKLLSLPSASDEGMDEVLAARDRAILSCFLYVGLRTSSVCALDIADFHDDPSNPVLTITEKGRKATRRRVGVHVHGAQALKEYLEVSGLQAGPFFRARCNPRSRKLGDKRISINSMYRLLLSYLTRLPHALN
ncbi:MAG: site-specific integrase, partial [Pseudomonadota bacterium]